MVMTCGTECGLHFTAIYQTAPQPLVEKGCTYSNPIHFCREAKALKVSLLRCRSTR
ncbi:hypothetical protein PSEUDO8Z_30076 [Pseudomonas sp. 8Z]|nr:hypothetical protein PSEUDO8Z_30076 [Pseudomonas sp. 8Z]